MSSSRRTSQRGNALVEFAIGWSVLWLMFSGVYEFGYSFYIYNVLMTSVANAAELGSKIQYDLGDSGAAYTTKLKNMVLYGDETAGTHTLVPGLTAANINVAVNTDAQGIPHDLTITIHDYTINSIFQSITPINKPRATTKYFGEIVCSTC